MSVSRGTALGLAALLALNLLEILHAGTSSADNWFCSLQPLPDTLARVLLAMAVPSFLLFALRPALPAPVRNALLLISAMLIAATARDCQLLFQALPEPDRLTGTARSASVLFSLLIAASGLLAGAPLRNAAAGPFTPFLFAATATLISFPAACIQSAATPKPLPAVPCLALLHADSASPNPQSSPESLADSASQLAKLLPNTQFLIAETAVIKSTDPFQKQLRSKLAEAGITPDSIPLRSTENSERELFSTLADFPQLLPPNPRRLVLVAPATQLARLNLLARRHHLTPLLFPDIPAENVSNPTQFARETLLLLICMSQPSIEFIASLRAPAETQHEFMPENEGSLDTQQLIRELQNQAAAEP